MQDKLKLFVKYYISHQNQEDKEIINGFSLAYRNIFAPDEIMSAIEMLKALRKTPDRLLNSI